MRLNKFISLTIMNHEYVLLSYAIFDMVLVHIAEALRKRKSLLR